MKSKTAGFRLFLLASLLVAADGVLPTTIRAETRTAAALTPEAVWDAINAAKDGDIVKLPEGTAVWKSGWNARHWAKMKAITIQGAGIDKTIIRTDTTTAPGDKAFVLNGVEGKPFRLTGITFDGTGTGRATGGARKGRAGFLQRGAQARVLQAVHLSASAAKRAVKSSQQATLSRDISRIG